MKRTIAFLLVLMIMMTAFSFEATAADSKLSAKLKEKLASSSLEEELQLSVWFSYPSAPDPGFTEEDYGEDLYSMQAYLHDYKEYKKEYYTAQNQSVLNELERKVPLEIIYISRYAPCSEVRVQAKFVSVLEEDKNVSSIYLLQEDVPIEDDASSTNGKKLYLDPYLLLLSDRVKRENAYTYEEIYYHYNENGVTDWALVQAGTYPMNDMNTSTVIGGRVITHAVEATNFRFGYGIYDVIIDRFVDLYDIKNDLSIYSGLYEAIWKLKIGRPVGDADNDGEVTILDATRVQRVLADLDAFTKTENEYVTEEPEENTVWEFSDMDLDGETTIMDATRVQRFLAGISDK